MFKIKLEALRLAKVCLKACYVLIKLLPTKNKVTLISRQADFPNIDFILIEKEIKSRFQNCRVMMLTKQIKNPLKYVLHIFLQMYHIATSRVVVTDSYCIPVSMLDHKKDLSIIQIWHSIGCMKQFGYAMIGQAEGHSKEIAEIMNMHKNYSYVLISSYDFISDFFSGFKVTKDKILEIPLPRADLLSNKEIRAIKRKEIILQFPELGKKKNIFYCPTFRKDPSKEDNEKINELIELIDFEKYNFVYKPHNLSKVEIKDERVFTVTNNDYYEIIFAADYMISDYSSIIYEAGLMGIPVYLYAYDWHEYKNKRKFNLDLEMDVPTLFTKNPNEIVAAINNNSFNTKEFQSFIRKNVHLTEEGSAKMIVDLMKLDNY